MARSLKIKHTENEMDHTEVLRNEYAINWKNLIFLPFNGFWQFIINLTILINSIIVIFNVAYKDDTDFVKTTNQIFYVLEVMFLVDIILHCLHRNMSNYRKVREHEPRNVLQVFFDILTVLPIYEVFILLLYTSRHKEDTTRFRSILRTKNILRLYRVYLYFRQLSYHAGLNQTLIIGTEQIVKVTLITDLLAAGWYFLSCWHCNVPDWTEYLQDHKLDYNNWTHWFIICYVVMGNVYQHNWKGEIRGRVPLERIIVMAAMLTGYIEHIMIFFGRLTATLTKLYRRQYIFSKRLQQIFTLLNEWKIEKELKARTLEYYNTLWNKRKGISGTPNAFKLLPLPLQKEVTLDIFWEALRHSHLFTHTEMPFKRALSLEMKSEFFLTGDYVYRLGEIKNKMVYIVSGILQILTAEDEESPIMSFSSGTIIGEISTIVATRSIANIRCATYTEVQTLSLDGLARVLLKFPEQRSVIRRYFIGKIDQAKEMLTNVAENDPGGGFLEEHEHDTVRWIKNRWRQLYQLQGNKRSGAESHHYSRKEDRFRTSKNLDLLVLSEEVELKIQAICLNSDCPFVMEPTSSFRRFCDYLILTAVMLQSAILPYNIAFERKFTPGLLSATILLDFVYFFDIYLQVSTAVKGRMHTISSPSKVLLYKMKRISFLVDLAATVPADYIGLLLSTSPHTAALLKINRLFKIYKLINFIQEKESKLMIDSLQIRLIKQACVYLCTTYWLTCIIYATACFTEQCSEFSWYVYNKQMNIQHGRPIDVNRHNFTDALYYTVSSLFLTAMSNTIEYVLHEMILMHIVINIGYYLFSFCFAELCATFLVRMQEKLKYKEYIRLSKLYLAQNKIPVKLRQQVADIRQFRWFYNESTEVLGEHGILNDAPAYLKEKLIRKRITECLEKLSLFENCDPDFLSMVAFRSILRVLPPGAILCSANNKASWMHVILRGHCSQTSVMAGDLEMGHVTSLNPGDSFPVIEMLHEVSVLTNVITVTTVETVSIRYLDLMDIFKTYKEIYQDIKVCLQEHLFANEAALLRKRGRLPEMIPAEKSLGQGDMFKYQIYDEAETRPEQEAYMKPFRRLGKWSYIRYFFMRKTLNPKKRFFISWELGRVGISLIRTFIAVTNNSLTLPYQRQIDFANHAFDFASVMDLYVRAHCQYYNDQGILVTHPWSCVKYYVKTGFFLDCYSFVPIRKFKLEEMFGLENIRTTYILMGMMTRPVQLHRLISALTYLEQDIESSKTNLIQTIKYSILVFVLLGIISTLIQMPACSVHYDRLDALYMKCGNSTWLTTSYFKNLKQPQQLFLETFYFSLTLLTTASSGVFTFINASEILLSLPILFMFFMLRWYILAKLASARIGGNVNLTIYQEQVKSFEGFVKKELIDEDLIATTIEHYQYVWKRTHGTDIAKSLSYFYPQLHEDLTFTLYAKTLMAADFFAGADNSFFRVLGVHVNEMYFKKDAEIIRCNDVQSLLYFVFKGKVDVIVAKTKMATMGKGGIFGCLSKRGVTRQTITVLAKVHVGVLVIESVLFHKLVAQYPDILARVNNANLVNSEYLESKRYGAADDEETVIGIQSSKLSSFVASSNFLRKAAKVLLIQFDENGFYFKFWHYMTSVHLAPISSLIYSFVVVMFNWNEHENVMRYMRIFSCTVDSIFLMKIYIGLHLSYKDPESGIAVTNYKMIRKRYFKSLGRFWLDLFTLFPFELPLKLMSNSKNVYKIGFSNRIMRSIYMKKYYDERQDYLNLRTHLRWTYMMYWVVHTVQWITCLWWLVACSDYKCWRVVDIRSNPVTLVPGNDALESILIAYTYTINMFSITGLRDSYPTSLYQLVVSCIMIGLCLITVVILTSGFATLLAISNYTMANYEHSIEELRIYLHGQDLSPFIFNKVWTYCLQLWRRQRGEWMPSLLSSSPEYLKQDLMQSLYGHHIENHYLFAKTHVDFIRQVVVHLNRCLFFPGNFITEKGDVDNSMYFIHDGEVYVYDIMGKNENLKETMEKGMSFGEAQGLLGIPHEYSYKAKTVVDAVILKRNEWEYLMHWFPASKEVIFEAAKAQGLKRKNVYL